MAQVEDRAVGDGDTITVYVDVHRDAREAAAVPATVMDAVNLRQAARAQRNYPYADSLQKQIQQAGYKSVFLQSPFLFSFFSNSYNFPFSLKDVFCCNSNMIKFYGLWVAIAMMMVVFSLGCLMPKMEAHNV